MWKYVVTWVIVTRVAITCPEDLPKYDEFGRMVSSGMSTNLAMRLGCYANDTTYQEKVFDSSKEALSFIRRGQDKKAAGWNAIEGMGELSQFKLDSIPTIQYNCQHLSLMVTAMGCPDNIKCNTATCTRCGKSFSSY